MEEQKKKIEVLQKNKAPIQRGMISKN